MPIGDPGGLFDMVDLSKPMMAKVLATREIQAVHRVNRCVRRRFLCGVDSLT